MKNIYIAADNIISALGLTSEDNIQALKNGKSGLRIIQNNQLLPAPICVSLTDKNILNSTFSSIENPEKFTDYEKLLILSIHDALKQTHIDAGSKDTLLIISTTKGSIDVLEKKSFSHERLYLWKSAQIVADFFKTENKPVVISNACISGLLAMIKGSQLIRSGHYKHVVVAGADIITKFVASGFHSFMALSDDFCRPFDMERRGLNLGEAAATVVLTCDKQLSISQTPVLVGPGFSANDATHISAPSRTAEGLNLVISRLLSNKQFPVSADKIDFISAHGTATPYNDEMESVALHRSNLLHVPTNSFKGYWGHTLGAAGIVETIATKFSMIENRLFKSSGYSKQGTTHHVNVIKENEQKSVNTCMKLASGFGGCNAGMILYKEL